MNTPFGRFFCRLGLFFLSSASTIGSATSWRWLGQVRARCESLLLEPRLTQQISRFASVYIPEIRVRRWVNQFDPEVRGEAVNLLEQTELIGYPDLLERLKAVHHKIGAQMIRDGFKNPEGAASWNRIIFSRPYTARSGDLISYLYRRVNRVRSVQFINQEQLARYASADRALVLMDDYAGTGAQLFLEYFGRSFERDFSGYGRVYLVVVSANEKAIERARLLKLGRHAEVARAINEEFALEGESARRLERAAANIDPNKFEFVFDHVDRSRVKDLSPRGAAFLRECGIFKQNPSAPFGAGGVCGRTAFFFGTPNSQPDLFWNSLGVYRGRTLIPLFPRVEDISHYQFAAELSPEAQVWGGE